MSRSLFVWALMVLLICESCTEKKINEIRIGYNPISYNLPYFIAVEKGYFKEEGLNIVSTRFATSNLMSEALVSNRIDVATSASITVLFGIEQNVESKFKIFMMHVSTANKPADFIIVKKNSNVLTIEDLRGKKVGTHQGSTMMIYAKLVLEKYFDINKDVTIIQLPPEVQIQSLVAGQVDALFTYEPIATLSLEQDIGRILVSAPKNLIMDPMPSGAYAFSTDFIEKKPKESDAVMKAMYRAVDFIREHPQESQKYITKYTSIQEETAQKIEIIPYWKLNEINIPLVQQFADILLEQGDLRKKITVDNLFISTK